MTCFDLIFVHTILKMLCVVCKFINVINRVKCNAYN